MCEHQFNTFDEILLISIAAILWPARSIDILMKCFETSIVTYVTRIIFHWLFKVNVNIWDNDILSTIVD